MHPPNVPDYWVPELQMLAGNGVNCRFHGRFKVVGQGQHTIGR
jgi:hypothetical protein